MGAMKKRSIAFAKRWNIPDWKKPELYPTPLPESNKSHVLQWKWEFLRRNEEYRQDWLRFRGLDHPFQLALIDDPTEEGFELPKYPEDFPDRHRDVWYVLEKYKLARLLNPRISHPCILRFGLLLVWWTPTYANSAFNSNSMGLRYPSVECLRRGL